MAFRVPKIKTCCCCISLRTGVFIIAGLDVLLFISMLLLAEIHAMSTSRQVLLDDSVFLKAGAFSTVFVYAIIKKDRALMFPWILQNSIFGIFLLNNFLCSLAYMGMMDARLGDLTFECIGLVHIGYTLLVVYNYYRELKQPQTEETI